MIEYKGYTGVFEFDPDLVLFAGHVVDLRDQIYFEGSSVSDLQESMKVAVDHYLDVCEQRDEAPGRPFSGRFNVRVDPDLHRRIVAAAARHSESMNDWLGGLIQRELEGAHGSTGKRGAAKTSSDTKRSGRRASTKKIK